MREQVRRDPYINTLSVALRTYEFKRSSYLATMGERSADSVQLHKEEEPRAKRMCVSSGKRSSTSLQTCIVFDVATKQFLAVLTVAASQLTGMHHPNQRCLQL